MSAQPEHAAQANSPHTPRTQLIVGLTVVVALIAGMGIGVGLRSNPQVSTAETPDAKTPAATVAETMPSFLYVVDGKTGSTTRTGADTWRLTLTGPTVLWFANRPATGSGNQSAESLVKAWPETFSGSPPNAAVLAPDGPAGHHPTAVKLTAPAFDKATGTVSFTLTSEKHQSAAVSVWLDELTPGAAVKNGRVVLFVDDALPSTLPPGTYRYVSPPQPTTITFTLAGAQGGGGGTSYAQGYTFTGGTAGLGGEVKASILAPANTAFQVVIGAAGGVTQGGGASAVYSGACAANLTCALSDRVLVAGGGGGGGAPTAVGDSSEGNGGSGSGGVGTAGLAGNTELWWGSYNSLNLGGGAGTSSAGGAGGTGYGGNGGQGEFGLGGAGGTTGGGTGGGGYYGGGGGGGYAPDDGIASGGGGGGSGYVAASLTAISSDTGSQSGDGAALITSVTPTIDLSASANPALPSQAVTYTATVSPAPPGGTITFNDGGAAINGCSGLAVSAAVASVTCPVSYPAVGSHSITAAYSGDAPFAVSSSSPLTETVSPAAETSTSLVSSRNPANAGASITFTATVTPAPDGGTVAFTANGTAIAGCGAAGLDSGVATCVTAFSSPGTYTVAAAYSGSASYPASSSTTLTETVSKGVTTSALSSSANPSVLGQQVTFTATVSPAPDGGKVNFTSGGATISGCGAVALTAGVAQCTTFYPAAGSYTISAAYSGDTNYAASTSPSLTETVASSPFG